MANIDKELADKIVLVALQQIRTAANFKKTRLIDIKKNEEFYNGRKIKVPTGRSAIPLPTMSGFVDTLMSKIDDPPILKYTYTDLADMKIMQKTSAAWQKDSAPIRGNWALKDRWAKKLACFSGRAIYEYMAESLPKYHSVLEIVDYEDFLTEPMGGGNLENHLFCGKDNVFRTKDELEDKIKSEIYEPSQVALLVASVSNKDEKKNEEYFSSKQERYQTLGLNMNSHQYVGQEIYKLTEWCMQYGGKRYYFLLDYNTGIWIRAQELKDVFRNSRWPYVSWATHEDAFNFWSKAPCDDVRPVADGIDVLFNQAVDNRNKKNFGQRAYDPAIFPNPEDLEWRPDGLVVAKATEKGKNISQGIYEFKVDEITTTIDLVALMKNYLGRETGINPESQGAADADQKVGIYFGNLQQMADRLGLYNKSYREGWQQLGVRYFDGLVEHLNEPMMVKMIGEAGVEWDELRKDELAEVDDFDIEIESGSAEVAANEMKMTKREKAIAMITRDMELKASVSKNWLIQEILKFGAYDDAEIKVAMSKEGTNIELLSEASKAIQDIIAGKKVKLNRGADTSFIQKIMDFATDNDIDMEVYKSLILYAQAHFPIAIQNMVRKAKAMAFQTPQAQGGNNAPTLPIGEGQSIKEPLAGMPMPGVSGGRASNILQGGAPVNT